MTTCRYSPLYRYKTLPVGWFCLPRLHVAGLLWNGHTSMDETDGTTSRASHLLCHSLCYHTRYT